MNKILIISDLHLSLLRPESFDLFKKFMQEVAPKADQLYILGDFFDFWIGDDDLNEFHISIINTLKALSVTDTEIFFMHGNRDFLVGKHFAHMTGAKIIGDPTRVILDNQEYLLMHGDTLCTDDKKYQFFRNIVRNPVIQKIFLLFPLHKRRKIAIKIREKSRQSQRNLKPIDVNPKAVKAVFETFNIKHLIHGHTHRPKTHQYGQHFTRIVLSDWHHTGSYIAITPDGPKLCRYP